MNCRIVSLDFDNPEPWGMGSRSVESDPQVMVVNRDHTIAELAPSKHYFSTVAENFDITMPHFMARNRLRYSDSSVQFAPSTALTFAPTPPTGDDNTVTKNHDKKPIQHDHSSAFQKGAPTALAN